LKNGKIKLFVWSNRKISAYIPPEKRVVLLLTGKYPLILLFVCDSIKLVKKAGCNPLAKQADWFTS
jgi:hypothetical protein